MKITNRDVGYAIITIPLLSVIFYLFVRGHYDLIFNSELLLNGDKSIFYGFMALVIDVVLFCLFVESLMKDEIRFEINIPNPFERQKMTEEEYREFQEWLKERRQ